MDRTELLIYNIFGNSDPGPPGESRSSAGANSAPDGSETTLPDGSASRVLAGQLYIQGFDKIPVSFRVINMCAIGLNFGVQVNEILVSYTISAHGMHVNDSENATSVPDLFIKAST